MVDLAKLATEPLELGAEDEKMLSDLAEFAGAPERVHWAGEEGLMPAKNVEEHAFYLGDYRGTFSLTKLPDGIVYRTMAIGHPEGIPLPGAVTSIAKRLGFTGSRRDGKAIRPGRDWRFTLAPGEPSYLVVLQALVAPTAN